MSFQLDKKQKVKEILKCGKDPSYFLKTYARISHPMHGLILFDTYDFQDELLKDFNDYRFNVILKARQLGISTITAGYVVWLMLFHRDKAILVMATKFATAGNLVKKVKNIIKNTELVFDKTNTDGMMLEDGISKTSWLDLFIAFKRIIARKK